MRFRHTVQGLAVALVALTLAAGCGTNNSTGGSAQKQPSQSNPSAAAKQPVLKPTTKQWSSPPKMMIDTSKQYNAVVHTNYGDFTIQLFAKQSPLTVNNFVFLAKNNFYHDDKFFRIIQSFMIQTGDPKNNGTGGPGYQFKDELPPKEKYAPGIVAMANAGANTNGSQFFIGTGQQVDSLNQEPNYTIFGKVVSGMDVVDKIAAIPVVENPQSGEDSEPTKTAYIESVDIQEK
ncbi:peptidylprolyl isomerase [Alicyclobacillus fastidiosus]|uniref:Peptidyl-prolyl cis-trans isomerase n=1 Tax=Alicyclobacillus fastidiosus TaxID=392011 RepID=A0ABV5ADH1_9BACL|nr:peptidylprolyl isomerase [Alicyclobacillus fastidiosus]WEH08661.1 peptidylprolyl isomerase [Alicyclobacillus fastidiosus]